RGRASRAAEGGGSRGRGQAAQRRDRRDGGRARHPGRTAARAQRLQNPAGAEPRKARDQGRGAGMTNFLVQWGINPWGEDTPLHAQWALVYVAFAFGIGFMLAHTLF